MRISILLVDCYQRSVTDKMNPYVRSIQRAARGLALVPEFVFRTDGNLEGVSGAGIDSGCVVISGSHKMVGASEFAPELLDFIGRNQRPLLGICYGHQVLARTFGAEVMRDGSGHDGRERVLRRGESELFAGFPDSFPMRESHQEIVLENEKLSSDFSVLAETRAGAVEAIGHRTLPLFGVQFHPERSGVWGVRLIANFLRIAVDDEHRSAR